MRRTLVGVPALLLLASLVLGGCSLGPREEWADQIHESLKKAKAEGGALVRTSSAVKVIETNIRQEPAPLFPSMQGSADFDGLRSHLKGPKGAQAAFADLNTYLPRSKASAGTSGKTWERINFEREPKEDIDDNDRRTTIGAALISPVLAVEMLRGVLTGSIKRIGTGTKAGVQATHYTAKLAPDAAVIEIKDEDRRAGVTRVFESIGVVQDIFPVDVWMDDQERVRGIRFVMRQQKDRVNAFELQASWEFLDYGPAPAVEIPARSDTIEQRRVRDLIEDYIRESALNF